MAEERLSEDPTTDLLLRHAFPALACALRAKLESIIRAWEAAVVLVMPAERQLSETQLRDHLPQILQLLCDALAEDDPAETRKLIQSPARHGDTRFDQNYDAGRFITEYRLLRRIVVEQAEDELDRRLTTDEDVALDMGLDDLLQRGVVIFIARQEARLRSSTEAEKKYLSFLSHDLRNNLNAVTLELEVLKRRLADSPEFSADAADLDSTQHSIFETIDGMDRLLQAERLRKQVKPKIAPVDLHALVSEVARHLLQRAAKKSVTLLVAVPTGAVIRTDRECVTLVLQNLLGNAVKYSAGGMVRVSSEFDKNAPRTGCVISVSDQGPGIAQVDLDRIFETFRRGDTHGESGVGLGLAIASEAAKMLGGDLTVESTLGAGSTFFLRFPADKPDPN